MNTSQTFPFRFYLRQLEEPFAYKCSPLYNEQMKQRLINWAFSKYRVEKGSKPAIVSIECDLVQWTALCFPLAMDLPKFERVYQFFQMFCIMDDHADESWGEATASKAVTKKYWDKALALLETLREARPWYLKELRQLVVKTPGMPNYMRRNFILMKKLLDDLSPVQRNRYINCFKQYMEDASLQAQMKGREKYTDLEKYKEYRVNSIASKPCTLCIEYLYDIELSDEEYQYPILQQLEKIGTLQIAFINDLFSIFKEYEGTLENLQHIISILVFNEGMTVQQAVDKVCNEIEILQQEFIQIKKEWYAGSEPISDNVRKFITGFEYYMAGNARWHRMAKRYHGGNFEGVIAAGYLEWSPQGTIYTPDTATIAAAVCLL